MTQEQLFRRAARLERKLRAEGVPAMLIPGILGGAFMASLNNLPPDERKAALAAHLVALDVVAGDILAAEQAPDGSMPGL